MSGRDTGARGEQAAARYLQERGYAVAERNFRTRYGEIDLIARDGDTVVFVEVKTRGDGRLAAGRESVTLPKRRRIIRAALEYAQRYALEAAPLRFDVIEIHETPAGSRLEHIRAAFDGEGF